MDKCSIGNTLLGCEAFRPEDPSEHTASGEIQAEWITVINTPCLSSVLDPHTEHILSSHKDTSSPCLSLLVLSKCPVPKEDLSLFQHLKQKFGSKLVEQMIPLLVTDDEQKSSNAEDRNLKSISYTCGRLCYFRRGMKRMELINELRKWYHISGRQREPEFERPEDPLPAKLNPPEVSKPKNRKTGNHVPSVPAVSVSAPPAQNISSTPPAQSVSSAYSAPPAQNISSTPPTQSVSSAYSAPPAQNISSTPPTQSVSSAYSAPPAQYSPSTPTAQSGQSANRVPWTSPAPSALSAPPAQYTPSTPPAQYVQPEQYIPSTPPTQYVQPEQYIPSTPPTQSVPSAPAPERRRLERNAMTIALLGQTGSGKSSTGNTVLGRKQFKSFASSTGVTQQCETAMAVVCGIKVTVIDTPDFFSEDLERPEVHIQQFNDLSRSRPIVYLLVMHMGRFTDGERETVPKIQRTFGKSVIKKTVLLFTGKEKLKGQSLDNYIQYADPHLQQMIKVFNMRCHAFDNNDNKPHQVRKLMELILEMHASSGIDVKELYPSYKISGGNECKTS